MPIGVDDILDNPYGSARAEFATDELAVAVRNAIIRKGPDVRAVLKDFPVLTTEDFADRMVQSFIDEYTAYADVARAYEAQDDADYEDAA